jgi:hypothetical protein
MMTDGKNLRHRTWEIIKKEDTDTKKMKKRKAARIEDTRETVLPESLNVSML